MARIVNIFSLKIGTLAIYIHICTNQSLFALICSFSYSDMKLFVTHLVITVIHVPNCPDLTKRNFPILSWFYSKELNVPNCPYFFRIFKLVPIGIYGWLKGLLWTYLLFSWSSLWSVYIYMTSDIFDLAFDLYTNLWSVDQTFDQT